MLLEILVGLFMFMHSPFLKDLQFCELFTAQFKVLCASAERKCELASKDLAVGGFVVKAFQLHGLLRLPCGNGNRLGLLNSIYPCRGI